MSDKKKRFRVRFHLGKGPNFMHWQVSDWGHRRKANSNPHRDYYSPETCDIMMYNCVLGNQPSTAQKIFDGANKTVCAWVDCDNLEIRYKKDPKYTELDTEGLTRYKYNPRKNPHWFTDDDNNVDGKTFAILATTERQIYG